MNTVYLEQMRMTLSTMFDAMEMASEADDQNAAFLLDAARTLSRVANSFALASIAESLTQVAGRTDCLAGIEESLNDIVGSVVKTDLLLPVDDDEALTGLSS